MSFMVKVFCPIAGAVVWGNRSQKREKLHIMDGRCTKCGAFHSAIKS